MAREYIVFAYTHTSHNTLYLGITSSFKETWNEINTVRSFSRGDIFSSQGRWSMLKRWKFKNQKYASQAKKLLDVLIKNNEFTVDSIQRTHVRFSSQF